MTLKRCFQVRQMQYSTQARTESPTLKAAVKTTPLVGRATQALTAKEKTIHEQGLVSVLKQIHDDLDNAVFDAYGWPHDLSDEEILERLVALNHERAEEEAQGKIRWLRPEFQDPNYQKKQQAKLALPADATGTDRKSPLPGGGEGPRGYPGEGAGRKSKQTPKSKEKLKKQPWPKTLPERITAVRSALVDQGQPADAKEVAKLFKGAKSDTVEELLETLIAVGQARLTDDGRYAA